MQKLLSMILVLAMILSLAACGQKAEPAPAEDPQPEQQEQQEQGGLTADDIFVSINDTQSNVNEFHRFTAKIEHETDQYLCAEIFITCTGAGGEDLGHATVFASNIGPAPTDWASTPFLVRASSEYNFDYEVVAYSFTPGYPEMPTVTDENVTDYIRMVCEDYDDFVGGERQLNVNLYNRTPKAFSGDVEVIVKSEAGEVVRDEIKRVDSIRAFGETEFIVWIPMDEGYSVEYNVTGYSFD